MSELKLIGKGLHATIELDSASMVVSKHFHDSESEDAASVSRREFECLERLTRAFAPYRYISCPRPVSVDPDRGTVAMTFCPGAVLDNLVNERDARIDEHLPHIAEQIADGVRAYVAELNEPFDLATVNFLYDLESRMLYFVDVSSPPNAREFVVSTLPLHSSLGLFIGSSIYIASHWEDIPRPVYWRRIKRLVIDVLEHIGARTDLDSALIMNIARECWSTSLQAEQRHVRHFWYATAGRALAEKRFREIAREWRLADEMKG